MAYQENIGGVGTTAPVVVGLFKNANDAHTAVTQLKANGFTSEQIGAAFRTGSAASFRDRDIARTEEAERILAENDARVRYEDAADTNATGSYEDVADTNVTGSYGNAADRTAYTDPTNKITYNDPADRDVTATGLAGMAGTREAVDAIAEPGANAVAGRGLDRVQLFGEVLRVHKDRINRGEVRVHKDVITENQSIEVPVTREEFVLERVPVSGGTPASSSDIGRNQEIRVPLSEERVSFEKQAIVLEEVVVGKRDVSDVTTVNDNVRHEELRVDEVGETPRRAVTGEDLSAEELRRRG